MNCICAGLRWVAAGYCWAPWPWPWAPAAGRGRGGARGGMARGDGAASSCMKDSIARIRSSLGPGRFIAAAIKWYKNILLLTTLFFWGFFSRKKEE
jgi:hypothetical protein